jgi:chloride channel protein, CIC family
VNRMADTGFTRLPVVDSEDPSKLAGMVSLSDLLHARTRALQEERGRERVLRLHLPFSLRRTRADIRSTAE